MDIGKALQGMGAGFSGRGAEWAELQQQEQAAAEKRRQEEIIRRQQAMAQDARIGLHHLQNNNLGAFEKLANNRIELIKQQGENPSDTIAILDLAKRDPTAAIGELQALDFEAVQRGLLPEQKPEYLTNAQVSETGQAYKMVNGKPVAVDIEGYKRDTGKEQDRALREKQIELEAERLEFNKNKPTAAIEKELLRVQDDIVEAQNNISTFETLANDYERLKLKGGLKVTVEENFRELLGSPNEASELRRKFNTVRLTQGLKYLPPGPATDEDVRQAMRGVPPENAPAEQVAEFLRGAAKIERFRAAYNQYKSDYIGANNSTSGINKNWRMKFESPAIKGRTVTLAEIYVTAQNRGVTPEEVAQKLGVKLP